MIFFASDIHCQKADKLGFKIVGVEAEPVTRVLLKNIVIDSLGEGNQIEFARDILAREVYLNKEEWKPGI